MFADEAELYKPDSPFEAVTLSRTVEACISDVKVWVVKNNPQLNDEKTEILVTSVSFWQWARTERIGE